MHQAVVVVYVRNGYANLMTSGKLVVHLGKIVPQATDQMTWVGRMNNIRNRATEIVNAEMIYAV